MRTFKVAGLAFTLVVAVAACGHSTGGSGGSSGATSAGGTGGTTGSGGPRVVSTVPIANQTGVSRSQTVSAVFDRDMAASSITTQTFTVQGTLGAVNYDAPTRTAWFTPTSPFAAGATLTATLAGVTDASGQALATYTWQFTVTADTTAPTVVSTVPAANATGVLRTSLIQVTFDKDMDSTTFTATTFTVTADPNGTPSGLTGALAYDSASKTATFTPDAKLPYDTSILVQLAGVRDTHGNALAAPYAWSFHTAPDTDPPQVVATWPAANATNAGPDAAVTATFDEPLQPPSSLDFDVSGPSGSLSGNVTYDAAANAAVWTPSVALPTGVTLTATLTGIRDLHGNAMPTPYTWTFTAASDTTPPTVTSTVPATSAVNVPVTTPSVDANFSEGMSASRIDGSTFTLSEQGVGPVNGTVTYSPGLRRASFVPANGFDLQAVYTATLSTGITDAAGNALAAAYTWSFTIEADLTPPRVIGFTPNATTRLVPINVAPTVTFDEAIDPASLDGGRLAIAGVDAAVSYDATRHTATLTPAAPLQNGTYTVQVAPGVSDLAGNATTSSFSFAFQTAPAAVQLSANTPADEQSPAAAFASSGDGVAAWYVLTGTTSSLVAARYTASTSSWAPEQVLQMFSTPLPNYGGDPAVWTAGSNCLVRAGSGYSSSYVFGDGTSWSPPLSTTTDSQQPAAVNPSGALVVTESFATNITAAMYLNGVWSPLSIDYGPVLDRISVAGSNSGFGIIWVKGDSGGLNSKITTVELVGASGQSSMGLVNSTSDSAGGTPQIASNGVGYAIVYNTATGAEARIYDGSSWSAPTPVPTGSWTLLSDGTGYLLLVESYSQPGQAGSLQAVLYDGTWEAPQTLPTPAYSIEACGAAGGYAYLDTGYPQTVSRYLNGAWSSQPLGGTTSPSSMSLSCGPNGPLVSWVANGALNEMHGTGTGWSSPTVLESNASAISSQVAIPGTTGVLWAESGTIPVRQLRGSSWNPATNLVARPGYGSATDAHLARADVGAAAVWTQYAGGTPAVYGATSDGTRWSAPVQLAASGTAATVANGPAGLLALYQSGGSVLARKVSAAGFGPPVTVAPDAGSAQAWYRTALAAGPDDYMAAWSSSQYSNTNGAVLFSTSADGTTWSAPGATPASDENWAIALAAGPSSYALIAQPSGSTSTANQAAIYSSGAWSAPASLASGYFGLTGGPLGFAAVAGNAGIIENGGTWSGTSLSFYGCSAPAIVSDGAGYAALCGGLAQYTPDGGWSVQRPSPAYTNDTTLAAAASDLLLLERLSPDAGSAMAAAVYTSGALPALLPVDSSPAPVRAFSANADGTGYDVLTIKTDPATNTDRLYLQEKL